MAITHVDRWIARRPFEVPSSSRGRRSIRARRSMSRRGHLGIPEISKRGTPSSREGTSFFTSPFFFFSFLFFLQLKTIFSAIFRFDRSTFSASQDRKIERNLSPFAPFSFTLTSKEACFISQIVLRCSINDGVPSARDFLFQKRKGSPVAPDRTPSIHAPRPRASIRREPIILFLLRLFRDGREERWLASRAQSDTVVTNFVFKLKD